MSDVPRLGVAQAEALMRRFSLTPEHLVGMRFAINVALATTIVWQVLHALDDRNPSWAIASMLAASRGSKGPRHRCG